MQCSAFSKHIFYEAKVNNLFQHIYIQHVCNYDNFHIQLNSSSDLLRTQTMKKHMCLKGLKGPYRPSSALIAFDAIGYF